MQITRITEENASYFLAQEAMKDAFSETSLPLGIMSDEGEAVGYLIAKGSGTGLSLERIYTAPSFRRQGYALRLLETLADLAWESSIPYISSIIFLTDEEATGDPALNLLKKAGFEEEETASVRKTYDLEKILASDPFKSTNLPEGAVYVPGTAAGEAGHAASSTSGNIYGGSIMKDGSELAGLECERFFDSARIREIRSDGKSLPGLSILLKKASERMKADSIKTLYVDISGEELIAFEELFTKKYHIEAEACAKAHVMILEAADE